MSMAPTSTPPTAGRHQAGTRPRVHTRVYVKVDEDETLAIPKSVTLTVLFSLRGFIGLEFSKLDSKSVRSIVGGAYGCYHLNDVIVFVLKVLKHTEVAGLCWV